MILILIILLLGISLSAFFSGSETGFYRVTRVRLVMDAKSGGWISRAMLWLVNRSTMVVATVLIGNNIANYLVSLGLLLASQRLLVGWDPQVQTFVPVIMTPLLFIYGELLPKYVFYQVPYQLLRTTAPVMLFFTMLFFPISIVVMGLEALWNRLTGKSASEVNKTLERQDLQRALQEGQEAGVVQPIQREIAQNLFTFGIRPVRQFAVPLRAIPLVDEGASRQEIIERAERFNAVIVGVIKQGKLAGCYQVADALFSSQDGLSLLPSCEVMATDSNIHVLTRMQSLQCPLATVLDASGRLIGVVQRERLSGLLVGKL